MISALRRINTTWHPVLIFKARFASTEEPFGFRILYDQLALVAKGLHSGSPVGCENRIIVIMRLKA